MKQPIILNGVRRTQEYGIGRIYDIRSNGMPDRILILSAIAVTVGNDKGEIKYTGLLESGLSSDGSPIIAIRQDALRHMLSKKYNGDHAPVYDNFTYIVRCVNGWRWVMNAKKMETLHKHGNSIKELNNVKHVRITEAYDRNGRITDGGALWIMYNNQLDETFDIDAILSDTVKVGVNQIRQYPIDIK